jgi:hypothetical protein
MSDHDQTERSAARYRPVKFDLPEIDDIPSLDRALSIVIAKAAAGEIYPRVALDFTRMMETRRRALSDRLLEQRLEAMEAAQRAHRQARAGRG